MSKENYYYKENGCDDFKGPFTSIASTEKAIIEEHKEIWETCCNCLQAGSSKAWCEPVTIYRKVKTVNLNITPNIKLVEYKTRAND